MPRGFLDSATRSFEVLPAGDVLPAGNTPSPRAAAQTKSNRPILGLPAVSGPGTSFVMSMVMTITGITNTQALYTRAAANMARRAVEPGGSTNSGKGQQDSGSSPTSLPFVGALAVAPAAAASQATGPATSGDAVQLSDLGITLSDGTPAPASWSNGFVEQFSRSRAAIAFSIPGGGGFGPISFAYEVENAYRVVRPLQPGEVIDMQA